MDVYEIKFKIFLLKDIKQEEALNEVASYIDGTLFLQEEMGQLHKRNEYKNYVFCSLYPVASDGVYKKENIYSIMLRTIDNKLADFFISKLPNYANKMMKGLTCEIKKIPRRPIERIYSLTPVILKDEEGYWKQSISFEKFEERIKINLIKKYNTFTQTSIDENFQLHSMLTILNRGPIKLPYKGVSLLGDKLEIQAADNEFAQKLIYMSLGTGYGESNARGFGYMNYQWYK